VTEPPLFSKVLIANRGEIAVRVIRACRELGIRTVAVFSDVDRNSLHTRYADEAYPCGPAPARESYLNMDRILEIAREAGAGGIHPGYGFLSENAEFARRCEKAGVVFIGPRPGTIESMGDKVIARKTMAEAGVPIVPGTTERLSDEEAAAFALKTGLPVMVKATAGGGGKGMRFVQTESELGQAIKRARSEAKASFGDDSIYVEKFVEHPSRRRPRTTFRPCFARRWARPPLRRRRRWDTRAPVRSSFSSTRTTTSTSSR
jgi:acetyl-CoA carboxylase biotin carboxylase subunit